MRALLTTALCCASLLTLLACGPEAEDAAQAAPKIPLATLDALERDLAAWAEGRWTAYAVSLDDSGRRPRFEIGVSPDANQLAHRGYCKVLRDLMAERLPGREWDGRLLVENATVHTCSDKDWNEAERRRIAASVQKAPSLCSDDRREAVESSGLVRHFNDRVVSVEPHVWAALEPTDREGLAQYFAECLTRGDRVAIRHANTGADLAIWSTSQGYATYE